MLSKVRRRVPLSIAMLALAMTSACGRAERPATAVAPPPDAPKPACAAFGTISFEQLPVGATDDPGNVADSDMTVAAILSHNAAWLALCANPFTPPG